MKFLLLLFIRGYWRVIPPHKRRGCCFRVSCSRYVFSETKSGGFRS
ncbi:MAG: membrane protein insertion efficiency factor YidD, partial [Bacteroidia bacterium]